MGDPRTQHLGWNEIDHHFGGALLGPPTGRMPMSHVTAITVTIPRENRRENQMNRRAIETEGKYHSLWPRVGRAEENHTAQ